MENDAITILVQKSIDKNVIKEEKDLKINFCEIILLAKMLLGMHWNCLMVTVKKSSTMPNFDCFNQGLHIQTHFIIISFIH